MFPREYYTPLKRVMSSKFAPSVRTVCVHLTMTRQHLSRNRTPDLSGTPSLMNDDYLLNGFS